ncbi:MAG: signal peptidase I [Ruminococcus sp.]|nr:signal peptidase I [Ruminococcus sp.]
MSKRKNAENQLEDSLKKQIDDDFKISKPNYRLDEIQPDDDLKKQIDNDFKLDNQKRKINEKKLEDALVQQIDNDFTFKKLNQELDENQLDDVIEKQIDNDYTFKKQNQDIVVDEDDLEDGRKFTAAKSDGAISSIYDWIRCLIFAFTIVVICLTFVFRLVEVEGSSMDDTLSTQDKVVVTNFMYKPQNNDIIVISHGAAYENPIIKRVIATEGQTLKLDYAHEQVIVNGVVLNEPYIKESTFSETFANYDIPEVIPEGKIFVMGDNRRVSLDSRNKKIGLVDVDDVIGKAQFVAFPFDHLGYLY